MVAISSLRRPQILGASLLLSASVVDSKGSYETPPPQCKPFSCPKGEKPAGNSDHKIWSYGCQDSGINFMNMGGMGGFNPNDPLGGMKQGKSVNKCCIEKDICLQTCGSTAAQCHNDYWACTKKICKGDQNCELSAMMGGFAMDDEEDKEKSKVPPAEYDYKTAEAEKECKRFDKRQKSACKCVPAGEWQTTTESNLAKFYKTHNPEKLGKDGEIKDLEDVWKKWKGKETDMFRALATKYKAKAVQIKTKPKPPPYTPPPPLSKEEQDKEDKRLKEQREKWDKEDKKRDEEKAERESAKAEEKEARERAKREEEDGETVEL